jgi:hypothetical protein
MKTIFKLLTLSLLTSLISSCNQPKNPSGIYRTSDAKNYDELDFQNGGTGRQNLFGKEGPFQWRVEEDEIRIEAQDKDGVSARFKWDGNNLILLGPNVRFFPHPSS